MVSIILLTSSRGTITDSIIHKDAGYLFSQEDHSMLAKTIERLINNKSDWAKRVSIGVDIASKHNN